MPSSLIYSMQVTIIYSVYHVMYSNPLAEFRGSRCGCFFFFFFFFFFSFSFFSYILSFAPKEKFPQGEIFRVVCTMYQSIRGV